ncbi:MAG: 3-phosphoshikimate 1-carboxyvinyltransferase [Actinomycetota bacterium]
MRLRVRPGSTVAGSAVVPGDKSIAHRWLLLAAIARGRSEIRGLPAALDVRSTASCLASCLPDLRPPVDGWLVALPPALDGDRFTSDGPRPRPSVLTLDSPGRRAIEGRGSVLDCGNSGTTLRLLAGVLAAQPGRSTLTGDASLLRRPMERVAEPLRAMGARIATVDGHGPLEVEGARLRGVALVHTVPSAQVKGATLLAGIAADGDTEVLEPAATRDHTERALAALGGPVRIDGRRIVVQAFDPPPFAADVPGDVSSAAFLLVAAALTGGSLAVEGCGLNPTRTAFLDVLGRMGVPVAAEVLATSLGEPSGSLAMRPPTELVGTTVSAAELPLLIDEVPALAALAVHARGETVFEGAGELRVKESDRLEALARGIVAACGEAEVRGDALAVAGGGLTGGLVDPRGDHRIAMAAAVAGLAARGDVVVEGAECADVSFPGFAATLRSLGADVEG